MDRTRLMRRASDAEAAMRRLMDSMIERRIADLDRRIAEAHAQLIALGAEPRPLEVELCAGDLVSFVDG
jgi:hypothetical protein